ncbi:hypothetical protein [Nitrosomonas sp.]|uniref:hypothetical protein n=1 Tax=Nitrosomonas sp. TaxID=42353 RepID=UPI00272F3CD0|nr:hypothetical protein [Nitrosomonas sp.]MDP1786887.1 hypothetical protein [Nitrosomonas sp.]MDP2224676.1 hypothetical protein [Nitrosomonas sp.]
MRLEIIAVPPSSASVRISWARLLKRVFEIDIEHCPHCGGNMKIIAAILERAAITKILNHLAAYLPGRRHDHLRRSGVFSIPADSTPSFSTLFLNELIIPLGRLSHERQKCF